MRDTYAELRTKHLKDFVAGRKVGTCPNCGSKKFWDNVGVVLIGEVAYLTNVYGGVCPECGHRWCLECGKPAPCDHEDAWAQYAAEHGISGEDDEAYESWLDNLSK